MTAIPAPIAVLPPLVVLMGVAGSGKTTVGRQLAAALGIDFLDGDDLHPPANVARMRAGQPLADAHRAPWLAALHGRLAAAAEAGRPLVVACSALQDAHRRLLAGDLPVLFVHLAADRDTLARRLQRRTEHFFPASLLDSQLASFEPPAVALHLDATAPAADLVAALVAHVALLQRPAGYVLGTALPVYDLGTDHVFARDRLAALFDLLAECRLLGANEALPVRPATLAELATVHDRAYIDCLRAASLPAASAVARGNALRFGLGTADNPLAPGQHDAAAAVAGATLACVDAVLDGRCRAAWNAAGGLHHAMPHGAAGFCLYNDVAIGIRRARERGVERVLYVDFDVHHGDGVERTFADDPSVLTISFHETPEVRYPGTGAVHDLGHGAGAGYALNVPLQPGTDDASFTECVARVLPAAVRGFRPGLIVSQHGCDTHREDPLATLACTTRSARTAADLTRALADAHCRGAWVATGGGGYQPLRVLPRAWAMVWSSMARRPLPDRVPMPWLQRWQRPGEAPLPGDWLDAERPDLGSERTAAQNRATVDRLFALVPWLQAAAR